MYFGNGASIIRLNNESQARLNGINDSFRGIKFTRRTIVYRGVCFWQMRYEMTSAEEN